MIWTRTTPARRRWRTKRKFKCACDFFPIMHYERTPSIATAGLFFYLHVSTSKCISNAYNNSNNSQNMHVLKLMQHNSIEIIVRYILYGWNVCLKQIIWHFFVRLSHSSLFTSWVLRSMLMCILEVPQNELARWTGIMSANWFVQCHPARHNLSLFEWSK